MMDDMNPGYGRGAQSSSLSQNGAWHGHRPRQSSFRKPTKRYPNRRIRRLWPWFLACVFLLSGAVWATHSRYFAIGRLLVEGNTMVPEASILSKAQISIGNNLWLLRTGAVRERIRDSFPPIEDVHLQRSILDPHTLVIEIKERLPWACVAAGGHYFVVDRDLRVLERVSQPWNGCPLAILRSPGPDEVPAVGTQLNTGPLVAALRCISESQAPDYGTPIDRVYVDERRNICLNVNGLGKAMLGRPTSLGPKLATLRTLARSSPALFQNVEYVDLQNPDAPAYVPRPEPKVPAKGIGLPASGGT